ncbi:MAG: hypothetical protein Q8K86_06985 [Candidatus Nanopelagicaceae bacterium]|nr:hypothetical protein [Candidatus Nanopelagicaceae bacterium]
MVVNAILRAIRQAVKKEWRNDVKVELYISHVLLWIKRPMYRQNAAVGARFDVWVCSDLVLFIRKREKAVYETVDGMGPVVGFGWDLTDPAVDPTTVIVQWLRQAMGGK